MLPLFGLAGNMGAGKSTVAKILSDSFKLLEVVQAAPMKEIAAFEFGFKYEALYGPTAERNKLRKGGFWEQEGFFENKTLLLFALLNDGIITPAESRDERVQAICIDGLALMQRFYAENGGLTARYVLQILGTEVGRAIRQTLWTEKAIHKSLDNLMFNCKDMETLDAAVISDVRFRSEILTIKRNGGMVIKVVDPDAPPPPKDEHSSESELRGIPDFWFDSVWMNKKSGPERLQVEVIKIMQEQFGMKTRKEQQ